MQRLSNISSTIHHNIPESITAGLLNALSLATTATIWSDLEMTVKIAAGFGNLIIIVFTLFWLRAKMKNNKSQERINQLQIKKLEQEIKHE